jgi:hypothetical protein
MRTTTCVALLLALALVAGCSTRKPEAPGSEPAMPATAVAGPQVLDAPAELAAVLAGGPRRTSYLPADLVRPGEGFASSLPLQRVTATAGGGVFDPNYAGTASSFAGLSFAMYYFQLPGYGGDPSVNLSWNTPPAARADVLLAAANWSDNRWDFYAVDAAGTVMLPSPARYSSASGEVLVCVVCTGSAASELDRVRIGSLPPQPALTATPAGGLIPLPVTFDASASADPDGTIAEYRWDPEGDGSFQESTGTTPQLEWSYPVAGTYSAGVRVIDNDGVYADAAVQVSAVTNGGFNFGLAGTAEYPRAVVPCSDGDLLLFGYNDLASGGQGYMAARVSPAGAGRWYRTMQVPQSQLTLLQDAARAPDGTVYACGTAVNPGTYGLVQHWTEDGELLWSKSYEFGTAGVFLRSLIVVGDSIYVCGQVTGSAQYQAVLLRLGLDGSVLWVRSIQSVDDCDFTTLTYRDSVNVGQSRIMVCGSFDVADTDQDAALAYFDPDGNRHYFSVWGENGVTEVATGVTTSGFGLGSRVYVSGTSVSGDNRHAFVSVPDESTVLIEIAEPTEIFAMAQVLVGGTPCLLLERSSDALLSSAVMVRFDSALALDSALEYSAVPDGHNVGRALANYGNGVVVAGSHRGEPATQSNIALAVTPSGASWEDGDPGQSALALVAVDRDFPPATVEDAVAEPGGADSDPFVFFYQP